MAALQKALGSKIGTGAAQNFTARVSRINELLQLTQNYEASNRYAHLATRPVLLLSSACMSRQQDADLGTQGPPCGPNCTKSQKSEHALP